MQNNNRKYPFFLIVDDGGFDCLIPEKRESKINIDAYYNIVKIAGKFGVKIPVCFTAKYLDRENISGVGRPLDYLDELMDLLRNNKNHIEIGYHGLVHEHRGHVGEFYCLDENKAVSESDQKDYINKSQRIFRYWGLEFPELFVPPYHAWEKGVTDKILKEFGVRYIVSREKIRFGGFDYKWEKSAYLEFFPRASLGVYGNDRDLSADATKQLRFFRKMKLIDFAEGNIIPQDPLKNLLIRHTLSNNPVHSYMTHIGNFSGKSLEFWLRFFEDMSARKDLYLCRSNKEAVDCYNKLIFRD